jgi:hypothetical protein
MVARDSGGDDGADSANSANSANSIMGGQCSSCSVDSDCQNGCGRPPYSNYVWCCGSATCYTWPNACPTIAMDAGGVDASLDSASDAPPDDGGLVNPSSDCQPSGAHGGHRWQDLYACYFGPTGSVSCGGTTGCHSKMTDTGSQASHFVCDPTPMGCWQSLTTALIPPSAASNPTMSPLYTVLCKTDGSGIMPRFCPVRLMTGDMARIAAWLQEGAPDN